MNTNILLLGPASGELRAGSLAPRQAEGGSAELRMKQLGVDGELETELYLLRGDHSSFSTRNFHASKNDNKKITIPHIICHFE